MIQFKYQPVLRDYLALNRQFVLRQFRGLIPIAGLLLVAYVAFPFIQQKGDAPVSLGAAYGSALGLLILPGILAFAFIATSYAARRRWKQAEELRVERSYEIDDQGVRVASSCFSGFVEWKLFTEVGRKGGFFFLKTAQNQFHFFPVKIVPDLPHLLELTSRHMPIRKSTDDSRRRRIRLLIWLAIVAVVLVLLYI